MLERVAVLLAHHCIFKRVVPRGGGANVGHYKARLDMLSDVSQILVAPGRGDKLEAATTFLRRRVIPRDSKSVTVHDDVALRLLVVNDSRVILSIAGLAQQAILRPNNELAYEQRAPLVQRQAAHGPGPADQQASRQLWWW